MRVDEIEVFVRLLYTIGSYESRNLGVGEYHTMGLKTNMLWVGS